LAGNSTSKHGGGAQSQIIKTNKGWILSFGKRNKRGGLLKKGCPFQWPNRKNIAGKRVPVQKSTSRVSVFLKKRKTSLGMCDDLICYRA